MNIYSKREIAFMAYCFGLLTGMIVAAASCSPPTNEQSTHIYSHTTQDGTQ